mgnify:CR=1 FL=1
MNGFKRDIKPKEDMNMKKNTETAKIPMINQVLKDAALGHELPSYFFITFPVRRGKAGNVKRRPKSGTPL